MSKLVMRLKKKCNYTSYKHGCGQCLTCAAAQEIIRLRELLKEVNEDVKAS